MKQSKLMSMIETVASTVIGFVIAIAAQVLVFPLFGFSPPLSTNFYIALIFTAVSIVRGFVLRRLFEALHIRRPLSPFMQAVIAERYRQIEGEGWSSEHDDGHDAGQLAIAGGCYAMRAHFHLDESKNYGGDRKYMPMQWPWSRDWWKPTGFRRDLVKAGALILAEGEKFDRNRKAERRG